MRGPASDSATGADMTGSLESWEQKYQKYAMKGCVFKPNYFAYDSVALLPENSRVLDLGCGQGQDAVYLATKGHQVTAADFSPSALTRLQVSAEGLGISLVRLDIREIPYPFGTGYFDAVYAHLSLHYFSKDQTRQIFREIERITRSAGWLFALFNSINDPELGTGIEIEPGYWEISPGVRKRFFSVEELPCLLEEHFTIRRAEYGTGTRKNEGDQFVLLVATTTRSGAPDNSD
jgi:SAM-dependent methyltransferase